MPEPSEELFASGVAEESDIAGVLPPRERLARGPVAIIECFQRIPCDPCAAACKRGAILPFGDVCDLPRVDYELCNGCGLCVVRCPGLAIFVVDLSRDQSSVVRVPYEFLPLPVPGQDVAGLDRAGREICRAKVLRAQRPSGFDRTALLTLEVPAGQALAVRGVRIAGEAGEPS